MANNIVVVPGPCPLVDMAAIKPTSLAGAKIPVFGDNRPSHDGRNGNSTYDVRSLHRPYPPGQTLETCPFNQISSFIEIVLANYRLW